MVNRKGGGVYAVCYIKVYILKELRNFGKIEVNPLPRKSALRAARVLKKGGRVFARALRGAPL